MTTGSPPRKGEGSIRLRVLFALVLVCQGLIIYQRDGGRVFGNRGLFPWVAAGAAPKPGELPVRVALSGLLRLDGYDVLVENTHDSQILEGVALEYTDGRGKKRTQWVGVLAPGERRRINPAAIAWRIDPGEIITVTAKDRPPKAVATTALIG